MTQHCDTREISTILDFSDLIPVEPASGISASPLESCLLANQNLQQRLRQYRLEVENELSELSGIEDLESDLSYDDSEEQVKEGSSLNPSHVNSLTRFLTPYFHDIKGFSAPENPDVALKRIRKEIQQAYLLPSKSWSKVEEQELWQFVTADNVRRLTESLLSEKCKLHNELKNVEQFPNEDWSNKQLENALKDIQDKIDDITETIGSFKPEENIPSREESEKLDWLRISAQMPTDRDDTACKVHWMNVIHPAINCDPWTEEENKELELFVQEFQFDWDVIAEQFSNPSRVRLGWQCMEQYQSKLNPEMKLSGPLTKSEAAFLDNVIEMCRISDYIPWHQVKYFIEGRTVTQLKHYWMKKTALKRGDAWTQLEDETLVAAVLKHGKDDWTNVANHLYGRTNRQCRERYMLRLNVIDRKRGNWTKEEDKKLLKMARELDFKWAELERKWEGRNARQLSTRYDLLNSWLKSNDEFFKEDNQVLKYTRHFSSKNRDAQEIEEYLTLTLGDLSEDKLDDYLKASRYKLMQAYERKLHHKGRKKKSSEEENVEEQLAEIFSFHSLFGNVQTAPLTRGISDQVVRDETRNTMNSLLSGIPIQTSHPLSKVINLALHQDITQPSSNKSHGAAFPIFPPNRAIVRGVHNLILLQEFLSKKAFDDNEPDSERLEQEKQNESYRLLLKRFISCFLWPSFLSNQSVPAGPVEEPTKEPQIRKNVYQIRKQRSIHALTIAKCRDEQDLLISSATGNQKLGETLKALELTRSASEESVSSLINRINNAGKKPKTSELEIVEKPSKKLGKKRTIPPGPVERKSNRLAGKRVKVA